jgi:hypothetical protein
VLFYTTLLIASLIVTLVILGLYNLVVFVGNKIKTFRNPDEYVGRTSHLREKNGAFPNKSSKAWGSYGHATPAELACTHPAGLNSRAPWGWPGNNHNQHGLHEDRPNTKPDASKRATLSSYLNQKNDRDRSVADWKQNIGRPIRDDRSGLAGKAYTPSSNVTSNITVPNTMPEDAEYLS